MIYGLGSQTQRIVSTIKRQIQSGELKIGSKLQPHIELAKSFGGTDGHKWVNGVLDKVAPLLRADEVAAGPRSRSKPAR